MVSPKAVIGICAGVSATLFIGYCIYFDKQRHNDPDFKKKLRQSMLALIQICKFYENGLFQDVERNRRLPLLLNG